jgi:hypothetical protein
MRLYISGEDKESALAQANLGRLCEEYLGDHCCIETVDVTKDPATVLKEKIFLTPALQVSAPSTFPTIFGTLSDTEKILSALGVQR